MLWTVMYTTKYNSIIQQIKCNSEQEAIDFYSTVKAAMDKFEEFNSKCEKTVEIDCKVGKVCIKISEISNINYFPDIGDAKFEEDIYQGRLFVAKQNARLNAELEIYKETLE